MATKKTKPQRNEENSLVPNKGGALLVGHEKENEEIGRVVNRAKVGLSSPERPLGSFMLLGPTGVGKTHTAKHWANELHGSPSHLLIIDCSEYKSDYEIAKLIGSPPGYIGHKETKAILCPEALNKAASQYSPISIVVFDEVEKGAGALKNLLLGILDRGILTGGDNKEVRFHNSLIFFTANLGDYNTSSVGITQTRATRQDPRRILTKEFRPEFVNRLTGIYEYQRLTREQLEEIVFIEADKIMQRVQQHFQEELFMVASNEFVDALLVEAKTDLWGARELVRLLERRVLDPIVDRMLDKKLVLGEYPAFGGFKIMLEKEFLKESKGAK